MKGYLIKELSSQKVRLRAKLGFATSQFSSSQVQVVHFVGLGALVFLGAFVVVVVVFLVGLGLVVVGALDAFVGRGCDDLA